jgi:Fis family transcriptional regulator, factor for inversion stimulation protein
MPAQSSKVSPLSKWCEGRQKRLDVQPIYSLCGHHLFEIERALILATLERWDWNRTHAAKQLGISVRTMRNKIASCVTEGIEVPSQGAMSHPVEDEEKSASSQDSRPHRRSARAWMR